jgi:hypothetical protein
VDGRIKSGQDEKMWRMHGAERASGSAAADLGDQDDLALGLELSQVGVLKDLPVDRHGHAFLNLAAEAGEAAVELQDRAVELVPLRERCLS